MPRTLEFIFEGESAVVAIDKVDRSELYGNVRVETLDMDGSPCKLATLLDDGKTLIPNGGTALAYINTEGEWVDRKDLTPVDAEGKTLQEVPSSFDAPIEDLEPVDEDTFLDHSIRLVYRLQSKEGLPAALNDALSEGALLKFAFSYRGGIEPDTGFLMQGEDGTHWMLVGAPSTLSWVELEQAGSVSRSDADDDDTDEAGADDMLDFGML